MAPFDYFALLGEERRPWLDPERVAETFRRLSRTMHPDQAEAGEGGSEDFAALNQAQQTLRDPKLRLAHLIGLEYPEVRLSGPAAVPAALADRIGPILSLLQEADGLLARKAAADSALSRALLARRELELRELVEEQLQAVEALYEHALADLRDEDRSAGRLVSLYQRFAYLTRWRGQLQEKLGQLGQD